MVVERVKNDIGLPANSENPRVYPDAIVSRFLYDIEDSINWHLHIIRHFNPEHADDRQMRRIKDYFQSFRLFSLSLSKPKDDGHEMSIQLFHCRRDRIVIDESIFSIHWDNFYNEFRISGLRIINPKNCRIKKTIFNSFGLGKRFRIERHSVESSLVLLLKRLPFRNRNLLS
jgi:hypothetical protein